MAGARSTVLLGCALLFAAPRASAQDVEKIEDGPPNKDGEEIIETIEDQPPANAPPPPVEPKKEPPRPDKFEFRGFTRLTVAAGTISPYVAPENAPPSERVGYDRGSITQHGYVDFRYSRGKTFQAVLSGSLAYGAYLAESRPGPVQPENNVEFGRIEPVLREAYVGVYTGRFDLRLGQQRIVWGNSDGIAPNDILNARDLRNRMQLDSEMIHLPTLAARADLDLGVAVLGLVAQPFFVPDQFSLYGSNWSLIQPDAPRTYRRLFGLYAAGRDRTLIEDVQGALITARVPRSVFKAGSAGGSLRFNFGKVDAAYYYYYGFDRTPFIYLDPQFAAQLDLIDPNDVNGAILDVFLQQLNTASSSYGGPLVINYFRRHHVGADAATTVGPFVLRVDAAYDSVASFTAKNTLNSIARPQAQGVFGIEYQTGDLNKIILLETWYMRMLGPEVPLVPVLKQANDGPTLFFKEDNLGFSNLVRWTFFENLIFESRSFIGATPFYWVIRPEAGYVNASFTARIGAMFIEGRDDSFGRYYRRNNTVYVTARYAF